MLNLPATLADAKESDEIFLVECYVFYLKTGNLYVCSADQAITINSVEYMAVPIQRDKFTANSDSKVDDCTLKVSNVDDSFTAALYSGTDFRGCRCDIFKALYPQVLTDATQIKPVLIGGYLDAPILDQKAATFECTVKAKVPNLSNCRYFQLSCNAYEFGDQDTCFADKAVTQGTCGAGTTASNIVLSASYPDNYFYYGIITIGYESRMIESSVGTTAKLHYPFSFIPSQGESYTVQRGCDKSLSNCKLIGQTTNFSGFTGVPYELVVRQY